MMHISSRIYFYVSRKHNVTFWAKYYCMCQAADLYACVCSFMVMLCCSCVQKDKGPAPRTNTFPLVCATLLFSSYFSFCDYGLFRNNAAILMRIGRDTEASKRLSKEEALQQYEMIKHSSALLLFSASTGGSRLFPSSVCLAAKCKHAKPLV